MSRRNWRYLKTVIGTRFKIKLETKAMPLLRHCNTGRICVTLPIITTEKNLACLSIHVAQKITVIRAQKSGKFAV